MPARDDDAAEVAEQEYAEMNDEFGDPSKPNSFPGGETVRADRRDAQAAHRADRPPTSEEERAAEGNDLDPDVAEAERAAVERGAALRGEGEITP